MLAVLAAVVLAQGPIAPRTDEPFLAAVERSVYAFALEANPAAAPSALLPEPWATTYRDLGSGRYATRVAAERALVASDAWAARRVAILGALPAEPDLEIRQRCEELRDVVACRACGGSGLCPGCAGWGDTRCWPGRRWFCTRCDQDTATFRDALQSGLKLPTRCRDCSGTGRPGGRPPEELADAMLRTVR